MGTLMQNPMGAEVALYVRVGAGDEAFYCFLGSQNCLPQAEWFFRMLCWGMAARDEHPPVIMILRMVGTSYSWRVSF